MNRKIVQFTFVIAVAVFVGCGLLGFGIYKNQPTADSFSSTIPAGPSWAADNTPEVPDKPAIAGDATDDGITNSMDINALLYRWGESDADYKTAAGKTTVGSYDIVEVVNNWHCTEDRNGCGS